MLINSTMAGDRAVSWALLSPSVSPYKRSVQVGRQSFSTNPAVRLYRYNRRSGQVSLLSNLYAGDKTYIHSSRQ